MGLSVSNQMDPLVEISQMCISIHSTLQAVCKLYSIFATELVKSRYLFLMQHEIILAIPVPADNKELITHIVLFSLTPTAGLVIIATNALINAIDEET